MKPVPRFPDAGTRDAVHTAFAGVGYTEAGLAMALGQDILSLTRLRISFELAQRAGGHTAHALLLRLFLAGLPATREEVHDLLGTGAVEALVRAGLLEGDRVWHACAGVTPLGDRLIARDRRDAHRIGASDIVPGPGPATRRFAVLAATEGGQITAADLNPRAVAYTEFNAALNGLDNITPGAGRPARAGHRGGTAGAGGRARHPAQGRAHPAVPGTGAAGRGVTMG